MNNNFWTTKRLSNFVFLTDCTETDRNRGEALFDFLKTDENLQYKQFPNMEFVPNLSVIDVLMFNSVEEVNKMLDNYILE